jgi:F-type H+-transporting ATPase subunit epsilon
LTEIAELAGEIDVDRARAALDRASADLAAGDDDEANESAAARARARLAAAGQPV